MDCYRLIRRALSTALAVTLFVFPVFADVTGAQSEPLVGPSGIVGEGPVTPPYAGPVIAPEETFGVEGGVDIPLPCTTCHGLGGTNEPAIAVNPLDPDNIAAASLFELRVSTDNGATFSTPHHPLFP